MATGKTRLRTSPENKQAHSLGIKIALSLEGGGYDRPDLQMKFSSKNGQAARLISSGPLSPLLDLHARPIEVVVYDRPSDPFGWENLS